MSRHVKPHTSLQPDMRFISRLMEAVEKDQRFMPAQKRTVIQAGNQIIGVLTKVAAEDRTDG